MSAAITAKKIIATPIDMIVNAIVPFGVCLDQRRRRRNGRPMRDPRGIVMRRSLHDHPTIYESRDNPSSVIAASTASEICWQQARITRRGERYGSAISSSPSAGVDA